MIHTSITSAKPQKENGVYKTGEFIHITKYFIIRSLFDIKKEHSNKYNDIVICLDFSTDKGYWRKDIYPGYKASRKKGREESDINFDEVFEELNEFIQQIEENLPWKVIAVPRAEADDIMLVLAREYNKYENILLHTPDKDMLQAQRDTTTVQQYSALSKKWLIPETKSDDMDSWITEHCILGDACDEIPKVVDGTEFSDNFLKYLEEQEVKDKDGELITAVHKFIHLERDIKIKLLENYNIYKLNRKQEQTDVKDVYKQIRFGPSTLQKKIKEHGSIQDWLNSHPMYRRHYDRNYILVMEEGIPEYIKTQILHEYNVAKTDYNPKEFEKYLKENNLGNIVMELPSIFPIKRELTAEDFDW